MIIICSWCKTKLGEKEPLASTIITHSICKECKSEVEKDIREYNPINSQIELLATSNIDIVGEF